MDGEDENNRREWGDIIKWLSHYNLNWQMSDIYVHCGMVKKLINKIVTISVYNDEHVKINITWLDQHYLVKSTLPG